MPQSNVDLHDKELIFEKGPDHVSLYPILDQVIDLSPRTGRWMMHRKAAVLPQ